MIIHPRDGDLIAATHGRGIWIMDDISPLQQMTPAVQQAEAHLFQSRPAMQWLSIQPQHNGGNLAFRGENPTRNAIINYYLSDRVTGDVQLDVTDVAGTNTCTATLPGARRASTASSGRCGGTPAASRRLARLAAAAARPVPAAVVVGGGGGRGGGGRRWRCVPRAIRRRRRRAVAVAVAAVAAVAVAADAGAAAAVAAWRPALQGHDDRQRQAVRRARSSCGRIRCSATAPGAPSALLAIDAETMDPRENKPPFWPQAGRGGR